MLFTDLSHLSHKCTSGKIVGSNIKLGFHTSPSMRQVLGPRALGRPRGIR